MLTVESHLSASGRVTLKLLLKVKLTSSAARFSEFLCHRPVLIGASIKRINLAERDDEEEQNQTFMLDQEEDEGEEGEEEESPSLNNAIYPLVKDSTKPKQYVFSIGRSDENDLVMADFAISKRHATIQITQKGYFLQDNHSTNGTLVNKQKITDTPRLLREKDTITFARYNFMILKPETIYLHLT